MRVTLLGTGSALPSQSRLQTGIHVERDGHHLLVDCGSGVTHRLAQAGVSHHEIETVLLTHHHLDHVADLPTLAKARCLDDYPTFRVLGPPGTRAVCANLFAVDDLDERVALDIEELSMDTSTLDLGPHHITTARMAHSKPGFAYRVDDALTISGDTAPTAAIAELADSANVLIHECAHSDGIKTDGHTTPTTLGEQIADIDLDRLYLTHLFPDTETHADELAATVSEYTDATVTVATDLDEITIDT
jgi:Metal-dependent hydrolases of the beta-lactamase superfamily III